jgi:protein SCO1/2
MQKKIFIILSIFSLIASIAFGVIIFPKELNRKKLPFIGQVGNFTLLDSENKEFSLRQLEGRVWVAKFFFTTCSDICPLMTKNMAALNRSFEILPDVAFVSITVNPENDTPERLNQYRKEHNAGKRWYFLTGPREQITDLMLNYFKIGSMEEPIFHSSYFALVDRKGYIRGYYEGTNQESINSLFKDVARLLKER